MKKWIFLVVLIGMIGWVLYSSIVQNQDKAQNKDTTITASSDEKPEDIGLKVGSIAPDFEIETMDGQQRRLSDFRGKPALLNFWATWCPPCKAEMPDMQRFYTETGMQIISVNLTANEKSVQAVKDFVKDYKLTFPVLLDQDIKAAKQYKVKFIPTTYILDKDGRIQYKATGPINYDTMMEQYKALQ